MFLSVLLFCLALSSPGRSEEARGAESPSDFPYHSYLCGELELQEFIEEQETCYQDKEAAFAPENAPKLATEEAEVEEDLSDEEHDDALLAAYDWHCQELEAKIRCITGNSHKCYNSTQVDNIVYNYLADHFYAFYKEASDGTRTLLPLCPSLQSVEWTIVAILTGRGGADDDDEGPVCTFNQLAELYRESSVCYDEAYKMMLTPGDFVSFFPNSRELRTLKRCGGARKLVRECQEIFTGCYSTALMEEVRKSGQKEVENVEEMILQFDGEEVRFADACGENFMAHKEE